MKKLSIFFLCLVFGIAIFSPHPVFAIEDPRSVPNNKIGIHILFPEEITQAAQLINSNGGDWGYVTIPIQAGEKDIQKWQKFMDFAKQNHIIPIIRLATEGDYFNTKVWRKPNFADVLDFANFLNSLDWPIENRYVTVFNEVNRGDEWGGEANPKEYAEILSYAVIAFKTINQNFFIISAGLDNAGPNSGTAYRNQYDFLKEMAQETPDIFNQIDGIASHSYPNPGFSRSPLYATPINVFSYRFEKQLIESLSNKNLPVFVTETGWSRYAVKDETIAEYYVYVFSFVWKDSDVIAVTPFLLRAGSPFSQFSFVNQDGSYSAEYKSIQSLQKVNGIPKLPASTPPSTKANTSEKSPTRNFSHQKMQTSYDISIPLGLKIWLKWILKI